MDIGKCLDTWRRQTLPADQFEIIVTTDGRDDKLLDEVRPHLLPQDRIIQKPGANFSGMYDVGVRAAKAPIVLITEMHCLAKRNCLEAVVEHFETHDHAGACLPTIPGKSNVLAAVEHALFTGYFAEWSRDEDWRKVLVRGFAIRRQCYLDAGGFDVRFPRFMDWDFAARLHSKGYRLGCIETTAVVHYYNDRFRDFYESVVQRTLDEYDYRLQHQQSEAFCDRYFGTPIEWQQRETLRPESARRLCRVLSRTMRKYRYHLGIVRALRREWWQHWPIRLWGLSLWQLRTRWRAWQARFRCWRHRNHFERLLRTYPETFKAIEDDGRLQAIRRYHRLPSPQPLPRLEYEVFEMSDGQLIGFYGRENWQGKTFRWSRAAAILPVCLEKGAYEFQIETNGLRGDPKAYVLAVFFNDREVPFEICGNSICGQIDVDTDQAGKRQDLAIVALPMDMTHSADTRSLGVPVFHVRFHAVDQQPCAEKNDRQELCAV
ncbi:MAG: hypothetical protein KatS3mg105_1138 [Gemmatales bacterium]|nr:MAG: hypothetical protein KatS3mg105_1138 [Gemmatales bacterium]